MSETKFTPGPWRISRKTVAEKSEAVCWIQGLTKMVLVEYTILGPEGHKVTTENAAHDARLIAASPSMYEALRECATDDAAYGLQHTETPAAMMRRLRAITDIARAALALADGKAVQAQ